MTVTPCVAGLVYNNISGSIIFLHHFKKFGGDWADPSPTFAALENMTASAHAVVFKQTPIFGPSKILVPKWDVLKGLGSTKKVKNAAPLTTEANTNKVVLRGVHPFAPFSISPFNNALSSSPPDLLPELLSAMATYDATHDGNATFPKAS